MKVLLLKSDHLGDFALSLPALWEVMKFSQGQHDIRILAHPANVEWGRILPWLPPIQPICHPRYDWGGSRLQQFWELAMEMRKLRQHGFGLGVNLNGIKRDTWGTWLMRTAGCRQILKNEDATIGATHETERIAANFPPSWGITGKTDPDDFIPPTLRGRNGNLILLVPFARTSAKQWPEENWKQLIDLLPRERIRILVPSDSSNSWAKRVFSRYQLLETSSIEETLQALCNCSVAVTLDTAVAHYAWLVGTPIVQLFAGTADKGRWKSLAAGKLMVHHTNCTPCKQEICFRPNHECMTALTVSAVRDEVQLVLGEGATLGQRH